MEKLDKNAEQIKLGFQLLLKPDFLDILHALHPDESADKSFEGKLKSIIFSLFSRLPSFCVVVPQYDKSLDYHKLALES